MPSFISKEKAIRTFLATALRNIWSRQASATSGGEYEPFYKRLRRASPAMSILEWVLCSGLGNYQVKQPRIWVNTA